MSYINSRTINHFVIYSYTVLYGFNQLLTIPFYLRNISNKIKKNNFISKNKINKIKKIIIRKYL